MKLLKQLPLLITILLLSSMTLSAEVTSPPAGWTSLFNGKDFSGWKQLNGKAKYHIEGDEIVGTTVPNTPNSFMATEKMYRDFILELEYKVDPSMNSGIQIRSNSLPDYRDGRVHGYQIEIDPSSRAWSGGIYDEARRGWLYTMEQNPPARKAFRQNEWNHYRIECIGSSIRTWVNGVPAADLIDDMTPGGFIALQVHGIGRDEQAGKQIRWRNIFIQTEDLVSSPWTGIPVVNNIPNHLSPQERAQGWMLLFDGKSPTGWRGAHMKAFPERGWKVENGELIVEPSGGAESQHGGDIVTMDEYSTFEFQLEFMITEGANSGIKYFITEQYLKDNPRGGSAIGLEYQILDDEKHADAKAGAGGNRTMASLYDLIPASEKKIVNKAGEWNHVRLVVTGTRVDESIAGGNRTEFTEFVGAHVEHWLNHRKVLEYERGTAAFSALIARSKYANWEGFGNWPKGRLLLQDHGNEVHFRSIKIRKIE